MTPGPETFMQLFSRITRSIRGACMLVSAATVLGAQSSSVAPGIGPQLAPAVFKDLIWRNLGPTLFGGRITEIDVVRRPGQPDLLYVLPENGGVFRSSNGGTSWTPIFDQVNTLMSMGDIAVARSNPDIIWVSTGHGNNPAYYWGEGVYKSIDAGRTWTHMGLKETQHIGRVLIHPTNPDVVFAAAAGGLWGPSTERGLFKTSDGGRTWKKVLYVDENTGTSEVVFDPSDPRIMFASTHQRQRKGYGGITIGPGSGLYRSQDGGETWTRLTKGLPTVDMGRIGISISPVDPKLVYADIEVGGGAYPFNANDGDCPLDVLATPSSQTGAARAVGRMVEGQGGVYRSFDGGETWEQGFARFDTPAGTFLRLWADPQDKNRVYRDGVQFWVSDDMGKTFRQLRTNLHADYRALWIDPDDNNHLIVTNDGGLGISWDRGLSWEWKNNIPLAQYWELNVDNRDPYMICGGTQDNGNWCIPSAVRNSNGITSRDAFSVGGGDGMHFHIDPRDSTFAFIEVNSSSTRNSIQRLNVQNLQRQPARPGLFRPTSCLARPDVANTALAAGPVRGFGADPSYRWAWNTPVAFSSSRPGVVYAGANVLFRSDDRGGSWTPISPDLSSRVDRDTVRVMGKPIGAVNYSPGGGPSMNPDLTSLFGQITWVGESPLDARVIYTGTDDGQVQVTRDGGATWTNVTKNIPGLTPHVFVSTVLPSRAAPGRVYATFDGHFVNDFSTYVYVSDDFGRSWRRIVSGLPKTSVNRIAEHPSDPDFLVLGHARGVHFSNDAGASWHSLSTNMPTIPTRAVVFQPRENSLIVGTYALGIWVLDDVGPLQTLTAEALKREAVLASITRGRQMNSFSLGTIYGHNEFVAPNPEFDPTISYYIRDGAGAPASITVSDRGGTVLRTMSGPTARGLNRVTWDMRMDPAVPTQASAPIRGGGRGPGAGAGPRVLPGTYTVSIRIPGVADPLVGNVDLDADPMDTDFTVADRRARHDFVMRLYQLQKTLVSARAAAQQQGAQLAGAPAGASNATRANRLVAEADRLLGIAGGLARAVESYNSLPTGDQRQQDSWLLEDARRAIRAINQGSGSRIAIP